MVEQFVYRISQLPDPAYVPYRLGAGGDVPSAIGADVEHVVRTLAAFPPESVSLALRFFYRPVGSVVSAHDRLGIYLIGQASQSYRGALRLLLEQGPLTRFYDLVSTEVCPIDRSRFVATCDVVRRQTILAPTVTGESNPRVLPAYYTLTAFEPRRDNDYLRLDSVLDRLEEAVVIEIGIAPADIADLRTEHTNYLAAIQSINRCWDTDDEFAVEPWFDLMPPFANIRPFRLREPLADLVLRTEQKNHEAMGLRHLRFHIRAFASRADTARLLASVVAESAFEKGSYELFDAVGFDEVSHALHPQSKDSLVTPLSITERLTGPEGSQRFHRLLDLGAVASADELLGVFRLPHASTGAARCIATVTDPPNIDPYESIVVGHDAVSMTKRCGGDAKDAARGITRSALVKHAFVTGMSGSGKTTFSFDLLAQLVERDIPFIVLESGSKREYRALKCLKNSSDKRIRRLARELRIFTPGNEAVCPLRFNPLEIPKGISRDEWIDALVACFKASMAMFEPLPVLLAESLEHVYEDCAEKGIRPTMVDLYRAARKTLAQKGYSGEVESNLRAALEVRLGELTCRSIGRIFACENNVPGIDELMKGYNVVELASFSREHGCLFALFLATCIGARARTTETPQGDIQLVIIFEEAHNIVGRSHNVSATDDEHVDPRAHASECVCRMLAEFRALGLGVLIVDQLPSAVAPEVVKNTATKMAFRLVDAEDRETIAAAMLFGPLETEEIARLTPGLGYFHTEGYHRARLIRTRNLKDESGVPSPPVGKAILPFLQDDAWFQQFARSRLAEDLARLHKEMQALDRRYAEVSQETRALLAEYEQIIRASGHPDRKTLIQLTNKAHRFRERLSVGLMRFKRGMYRSFMENEHTCPMGEELRALHKQLTEQFHSALEPAVTGCLRILDNLIAGSHKIHIGSKEKTR